MFSAYLAVCFVIVGFFGLAGPRIMNLLSRHDPNPELRDRAATLGATHEIIRNGTETEIPEESLLARDHGRGPGRINCVIMGARAEKAGRHAEAYLWFALDARAREMNDVVKAYEDEALRLVALSDVPDRTGALAGILKNYNELKARLDEEQLKVAQ